MLAKLAMADTGKSHKSTWYIVVAFNSSTQFKPEKYQKLD